jgi:hypothetical protein
MHYTLKKSALACLAIAGALLAVAASCTAFSDAEIFGRDAQVIIVAGEGGATCDLATFPVAPPPSTEAPSIPDLVLTVHDVSFQNARGIDQDGKCTCINDGVSSCRFAGDAGPPCDSDGGRDNFFPIFIKRASDSIPNRVQGGLGALIKPQIEQLFNFDGRAKEVINGGSSGLVLVITKYNGKADDPEVGLELRPSKGRVPKEALVLNGNDVMQVYESDPDLGGTGWVTKGTLYVTLKRAELPFDQGSIARLFSARVAMPLRQDPQNSALWRVEAGELSGRWGREDLLRTVDQLRLQKGGPTICAIRQDAGTSQIDGLVREVVPQIIQDVCAAPDIASDTTQDQSDTFCRAISTAILFNATSAKIDPTSAGPLGRTPECVLGRTYCE